MRKLLLSIFCAASLSANSLTEIEKLKLENEILKQRLDILESKISSPFDDFFKDFNEINEQHIKAMNRLYTQMHDEFHSFRAHSNYASYFQSNEIISYIKENTEKKDKQKSSKIELKTYNEKSKKEYLLKDIIKDFAVFKKDFKSDFAPNKFYLNSQGFVFLSEDLLNSTELSYEEMKKYLKEDFLKALGV